MSKAENKFTKQLRRVIEFCRETGYMPNGDHPRCMLCHFIFQPGEPVLFDFFLATNQKRIGAPLNKIRAIVCALCESCAALPDRNERVERKVFAEIEVQ